MEYSDDGIREKTGKQRKARSPMRRIYMQVADRAVKYYLQEIPIRF